MSAQASVVHYVPGRCRLRLPHMRGDTDFFDRLRGALAGQYPDSAVSVSAVTGSVLMAGVPASLDDLREFGREHGWYELAAGEDQGSAINGDPVGLSGISRDDARRYMILAFLALAVMQVARGQILVPATSLLWYAFDMTSWPSRAA